MVCYESSWLIFVKAILINDISTKEFFKIICKPDVKISPSVFHWWESHQVEIPALARTLGLPSSTIDQGFIDRLIVSEHSVRNISVRHCPTCIEHNYHSPFFQLSWLAACPWHNVPLEECRTCSSFLNGCSADKIKSGALVSKCIHITKLRANVFPLVTLPEKIVESMGRWSEATVAWLRAAQALGLEDVWDLMSRSPSIAWNKKLFLYFRFIEQRVGFATFDIAAPFCKVKHVMLPTLRERKHEGGTDYSDKQDLMASFRSMRRYFYKTFVHSHKKCFNTIRQLDVMQSSKLDLTVCCGCVIAYLSWLMSYSEFFRIAEVVRKTSPAVKDEEIWDVELQRRSNREILTMAFIKFNDIWAALELYVECVPKCSTLVVYKDHIRNNFLSPLNFTFSSSRSSDALMGCTRYYCVADEFLKQKNSLRCSRRDRKPLVFLDEKYFPDYDAISIAPSRIFVLADRSKFYKIVGYVNI
jgi:hypothetical protein